MSRFSAIPPVMSIPGIEPKIAAILDGLATNVALLTGQRGETDKASQALTSGQITIGTPPASTITRVSAEGAGFIVSSVKVASATDYGRLVVDVQKTINDLVTLREYVRVLANQLKGKT